MTRKHRHSATALTLASAGLLLVLMTAQPAPLNALSVSIPSVISPDVSELPDARSFAADTASSLSVTNRKSRSSRRMRQHVSMPFFSFAPRG